MSQGSRRSRTARRPEPRAARRPQLAQQVAPSNGSGPGPSANGAAGAGPAHVRQKAPIRLFRSDLLESLSHVHPAVVIAVWTPVALFFLARAVLTRPEKLSLWLAPLAVLGGLVLWTLTEYLLHRFVFHFRARRPWQERLTFLMHGVHHAQPLVKTRLMMPIAVSLPLAGVFYGLFWLVLGFAVGAPWWVAPTFGGFVLGYLAYDSMHYRSHHGKLKLAYMRAVRQYHGRHHSQTPNKRFGVSSPLWDHVFGTLVQLS